MSRQENLEGIMSMGFRHKMGRELDPNFSKLSNSLGYVIPPPLGVWLVVLRLNVPVNNFSVMAGRSHRFLGN